MLNTFKGRNKTLILKCSAFLSLGSHPKQQADGKALWPRKLEDLGKTFRSWAGVRWQYFSWQQTSFFSDTKEDGFAFPWARRFL
jgi:hypothetical protein